MPAERMLPTDEADGAGGADPGDGRAELAPIASEYEGRAGSRARSSGCWARAGCSACPTRSGGAAAGQLRGVPPGAGGARRGMDDGRRRACRCTRCPASRWPTSAPTSSAPSGCPTCWTVTCSAVTRCPSRTRARTRRRCRPARCATARSTWSPGPRRGSPTRAWRTSTRSWCGPATTAAGASPACWPTRPPRAWSPGRRSTRWG